MTFIHSTGRNLEFPGLGNPKNCVGQVTFPVHGMYISYCMKCVHFLGIPDTAQGTISWAFSVLSTHDIFLTFLIHTLNRWYSMCSYTGQVTFHAHSMYRKFVVSDRFPVHSIDGCSKQCTYPLYIQDDISFPFPA